ncbi:hypothetical protein EMIT0P265_40349 [Pseudomonas zeae]
MSYILWRAPSSPHLAWWLNRSFIPQSCDPLSAAKAGLCHAEWNETKSLRIPAKARAPDAFSRGSLFVRHEAPSGTDFQERSRKKVMW